jgi:RNA polymerase sigma factor (sigma-70 family)
MPERDEPPHVAPDFGHGGAHQIEHKVEHRGEHATERARFEEIYRETYPALLGYLVRRVEDPADAADALAETYTVAWRRRREMPRQDGARPWLFGVARYVLANQRRATRRRDELTRKVGQDVARVVREAVGVQPQTSAQELAVRSALARLPEGDRELLTLIAWEGLERGDLAVALGCSRATVRVRLHRARRRFAEALSHEGVVTVNLFVPSEPEEARA